MKIDLTNDERMRSIELLTQAILGNGAGAMLAAGMSESAVVRLCENVSDEYHRRMFNRYEKELQGIPD